jgi:hypothetical protein
VLGELLQRHHELYTDLLGPGLNKPAFP